MIKFNEAIHYVKYHFGINIVEHGAVTNNALYKATLVSVPDTIWRRVGDNIELKYSDKILNVDVQKVDVFLTLLALHGPIGAGIEMRESVGDMVLPCADLVFNESLEWLEQEGLDVETLNCILGFLLVNTSYKTRAAVSVPSDVIAPEPIVIIKKVDNGRARECLSEKNVLLNGLDEFSSRSELVLECINAGNIREAGSIGRRLNGLSANVTIKGGGEVVIPKYESLKHGSIACYCDGERNLELETIKEKHTVAEIRHLVPQGFYLLVNRSDKANVKLSGLEWASFVRDYSCKFKHYPFKRFEGVRIGQWNWVEGDGTENFFKYEFFSRNVLVDRHVRDIAISGFMKRWGRKKIKRICFERLDDQQIKFVEANKEHMRKLGLIDSVMCYLSGDYVGESYGPVFTDEWKWDKVIDLWWKSGQLSCTATPMDNKMQRVCGKLSIMGIGKREIELIDMMDLSYLLKMLGLFHTKINRIVCDDSGKLRCMVEFKHWLTVVELEVPYYRYKLKDGDYFEEYEGPGDKPNERLVNRDSLNFFEF